MYNNDYEDNKFEKINLCLSYIDPNMSREDWVRIGFALCHELGPNGYAIFDNWSQKGSNYDEKSCQTTWKSILRNSAKSGFSFGTLYHYARQNGMRAEDLKNLNSAAPSDPEVIKRARKERDEFNRKLQAESARKAKFAQQLALRRWNLANAIDQNTSHPYLSKKKIRNSLAARIYKGWLQIPAFNKMGELTTLQSISPDCKKIIIKDSVISGSSLSLGGNPENKKLPILLCEGWATGETLQAASRLNFSEIGGLQVVVSFNSNNLSHIAANIREKYPERTIILCADNDAKNKVNTGLEKAKALQNRYNNFIYIYPKFSDEDIKRNFILADSYPTDFNDLYILNGLNPVKDYIIESLTETKEYNSKFDNTYGI